MTVEQHWEQLFIDYLISSNEGQNDASHDLGHFRRVYHTAKQIAIDEPTSVDPLVILAAAYFHDVVSLPKNHPDNKMSSRYAAVKTREILQELNFPSEKIDSICHAIEAHSFSAQIEPETLEAKIIQDADRMESLGALGVMRTFYVSGRIGREPFDSNDLHAKNRPLDDKRFGLDHFYAKLLKLPELLQTEGGRRIANTRTPFLRFFMEELEKNIQSNQGGALVVVWSCYHAGRLNLMLFDPINPMATNRPLNPEYYAFDRLIEMQEQFPEFISQFISQFQAEIQKG